VSAANGHFEIVKYLVEKGADMNMRDYNGRSALDIARRNGHQKIVEFMEKYKLEHP